MPSSTYSRHKALVESMLSTAEARRPGLRVDGRAFPRPRALVRALAAVSYRARLQPTEPRRVGPNRHRIDRPPMHSTFDHQIGAGPHTGAAERVLSAGTP